LLGWPARWLSAHCSTVSLIAFIALWQIASVVFDIPSFLLPSPYQIGVEIVANRSILLAHASVTCLEILAGFLISVLIGLPLAAMFVYSRILEKAIFPLIVGSNTVPKVALAPLLLAWFGFGLTPKILIVVLVAFFPIIINAVVGLRSMPPQMLYLARSMGATPLQTFWLFQLPSAMPHIFAGLKIATSLSVIGAVVAEFVGADGGLGYIMMVANADLNIARQFAAIVVLSLIGMIFFWSIDVLQRILLPWHVSIRGDAPEASPITSGSP
jgi:NitT/TauT family transport system permease protein